MHTTPETPPTTTTPPTPDTTSSEQFVLTETQFDQMFPERNPFYTYAGLVDALAAYPEFATTGSPEIRAREVAALLANVDHETLGLRYVTELNTALHGDYCDPTQPYGCPAGQDGYFGRGPLQLSWNFNYKAAGDALGIDLLHHPELVETDASVAWQTGIWYWMTQPGEGEFTGHEAIVAEHGFAEAIRAINGPLECDGGNPRQVRSRVEKFTAFCEVLGTTPGDHLSC